MADLRRQDCDLIMKGGVTSGLVYPGAIAELAKTYRLRNIGGTSAGAIGAVAAAAMEYGLRTGRNPQAREQMGALAAQLSEQTDGGASRLDAMFSGDAGTAPLLNALKAMLGGNTGPLIALGTSIVPRNVLVGFAVKLVFIAFLFALVAAVLTQHLAGVWHVLATVVATGLGGWLAVRLFWAGTFADARATAVANVEGLLHPIVGNGFGLATGLAPTGHSIGGAAVPSLNEWLHGVIQRLAGHAADNPFEVMTFGKLWTMSPSGDPSAYAAREVDLVLVCSDLNRLQSASFPFLPDNQRLFYDPAEWARLFPEVILDAMAPHAPQIAGGGLPDDLGYSLADIVDAAADLGEAGTRLRLLPKGKNLPILVGARASMAFPGLFTPLPLWVLRWVGRPEVTDERRPVLSRVYLSDGGITSNFPIHLFDAAVPSRPTFAINLLYPDDDLSIEEYVDESRAALTGKAVPGNVRTLGGTDAADGRGSMGDLIMPYANRDRVAFYKAPAGGSALAQLAGFGSRVVETARTWGDVGLYNQVGMRDRIIHVRLSGEEGGFNLAMSTATISALDKKGCLAGAVLGQRFHPAAPSDPLDPVGNRFELTWANHVRIRAEGFLVAQDLLSGRFAANWPLAAPMITDAHLLGVAGHVGTIAAMPAPDPDPAETALRPLNVLRMRPAGADPRASRRADSP